jgi:hypothetical protein
VVIDDETVHPVGDDAPGSVDEEAAEAAPWVRGRLRTLSEPFGTTIGRDGNGVRIPLGNCDG